MLTLSFVEQHREIFICWDLLPEHDSEYYFTRSQTQKLEKMKYRMAQKYQDK